jgi:hypothetical protein
MDSSVKNSILIILEVCTWHMLVISVSCAYTMYIWIFVQLFSNNNTKVRFHSTICMNIAEQRYISIGIELIWSRCT